MNQSMGLLYQGHSFPNLWILICFLIDKPPISLIRFGYRCLIFEGSFDVFCRPEFSKALYDDVTGGAE